ncbi:hypothetical protein O181_073953 [Austropuccinia psidii MF-1]|uniref:Uncharacterized protein n=1 Tax=Austropuccinia psidii MF-1 TaxID=1389203 RepID=A0A9Q3FA42_9BASI|nr:hypothetical protein [Austropuccinia psidii MF-1]
MDFCTCTSCRTNSVTCANGQTCQGLYVNPRTRMRHWAKDSSHQEKSLSSIDNEESNGDSSEIAPRNKEAISSTISRLINHFIMWLYLSCGLRRDMRQKARDMLVHILQNVSDEIPQLKVPCNFGTISKQLKLDFPFEQHVCCPRCYSFYDVEFAPGDCIYKPTATGTPCGTEILRQKKINPLGDISFTSYNSIPQNQSHSSGQIRLQGQPHLRIPQASFFSQSVLSWLEWFLNVPEIEHEIDDWACELSSHKSTIVSNFT